MNESHSSEVRKRSRDSVQFELTTVQMSGINIRCQVISVFKRFQIRFTAVTDGWYKTNKLQKV